MKHTMINNNWINYLNTWGLKLFQEIKITFQNIAGMWDFAVSLVVICISLV